MANLNDVARAAHVSKMTVSRVINHPNKVSPELQKIVEDAIVSVGYVPNQIARALVNQKHYVIRFLILEDVATVEPNYAKLLILLADNLKKYGYTLEISLDITEETKSIDGLIVSGWRQKDLAKLQLIQVPVVLYGVSLEKYQLSSVDVDNELGMEKATQYMLDKGYQDIYYLGLTIDLPFAVQREQGYRKIMRRYQMTEKVYNVGNHAHLANELIIKLMSNFKTPTGIVCASDRIAFGVLRGLQTKYKIPNECGVIGFDGVFIDQLTAPQLTTIRQPFELIAKKIVDQIIMQVESKNKIEPQIYSIVPEIVIRKSTELIKCYR